MNNEVMMNPRIAIAVVTAFVGSNEKLAQKLGVGKSTICGWRRREKVAPEFAKIMSEITGGRIQPKELCPDVF